MTAITTSCMQRNIASIALFCSLPLQLSLIRRVALRPFCKGQFIPGPASSVRRWLFSACSLTSCWQTFVLQENFAVRQLCLCGHELARVGHTELKGSHHSRDAWQSKRTHAEPRIQQSVPFGPPQLRAWRVQDRSQGLELLRGILNQDIRSWTPTLQVQVGATGLDSGTSTSQPNHQIGRSGCKAASATLVTAFQHIFRSLVERYTDCRRTL